MNQTTGSATLSQYDYAYDQSGQIVSWTQQAGTNPAMNYAYNYDATGALTRASQSPAANLSSIVKEYAYLYDRGDNRITEQVDGVPRGATYNNLNQLTGRMASGTGSIPVTGTATRAF